LKLTPNQIEYYIDCCVYINFGKNFKFFLALFENNSAKIFDAKSFKVVQELHYPSNYAKPKEKIENASIIHNITGNKRSTNVRESSHDGTIRTNSNGGKLQNNFATSSVFGDSSMGGTSSRKGMTITSSKGFNIGINSQKAIIPIIEEENT
jgi:hypothetical protein